MNKKQIITGVVASLSVLTTTASLAKSSKADFYGKIFLVNEQRTYDHDSDQDGSYMSSNASRVGVKGKYKTDVKGLDVIYQIEMQVDIDNDEDLLKARNQFVGLKHKKAGSLIAGNHDTAFKLAQNKVDLFNDYHLGDFKNTFSGESRLANTLMYSSPSIKGIQARVATHSDTDAQNSNSISLSYKYNKNLEVSIATNNNIDNTDATRLVAQYKNKKFSVGLVHQDAKQNGTTESKTATLINGLYALDKKTNLKLQLSSTEQQADSNANNATIITTGVDYKLSKKSTAVAYYSAKNNNYPSGFSGTEEKESLLGVGLVHKF